MADHEAGLEITQPASGAVYFWDASIPDNQRAVGLETVGRPEDRLEIWVNGRRFGLLPESGSAVLPIRTGAYAVEVRGSGRTWAEIRFPGPAGAVTGFIVELKSQAALSTARGASAMADGEVAAG